MTGRERVIASLRHEQPERLAIDFGGMRSTGIHVLAYLDLVRRLGLVLEPPRMYDVFQQLAEPQEEVLGRLGGDVVQAHMRCPAFGIPLDEGWRTIRMWGQAVRVPEGYRPVVEADGKEYLFQDGVKLGCRPRGGLYFDQVIHPLAYCGSASDIDAIPLAPLSDRDVDFVAREARELFDTTDRAVLLPFGGSIFEAGQMDFGYEAFFVNLLTEPELMHHYFNRLADLHMENLKKLLPRVEGCVQVIQFGDDLGTQQAPQISLQTYREMIKPYHMRQYSWVREHFPQMKVFLHSCGAVAPLIPDFIDAGVEVLNPVQLTAAGMDPLSLKKEYGNALSFWGGGANTSTTMTFGSAEACRRETEELISIFSPGGGFVFTQVHNIQPGIPPENILAVYDTALGFR